MVYGHLAINNVRSALAVWARSNPAMQSVDARDIQARAFPSARHWISSLPERGKEHIQIGPRPARAELATPGGLSSVLSETSCSYGILLATSWVVAGFLSAIWGFDRWCSCCSAASFSMSQWSKQSSRSTVSWAASYLHSQTGGQFVGGIDSECLHRAVFTSRLRQPVALRSSFAVSRFAPKARTVKQNLPVLKQIYRAYSD